MTIKNHPAIYACSKCGAQSPKWQGRCLECGAWGTMILENIPVRQKNKGKIAAVKTAKLATVTTTETARLKTGLTEFDRVLGGGIVGGSLVLLGGDPGIGKSTLAMQIAKTISNILYVSGEESAGQVKLRAERIGLNSASIDFLAQTDIDIIAATVRETKPPLVIIDSIQTMASDGILGGVGQIIAATGALMTVAKELNIPALIIGHVTKEGTVAGPKALEHLVDVVLYLENDSHHHYKILRGIKNRFGSTGEIGVFEMTDAGFREVKNPSRIFADREQIANLPGAATTVVMEGTRPFMAEIQALVIKTSFGYPQRKATGFDLNRLQMLVAVIGKTAKINLNNCDIYLNVAGGLKIKETGADLAVCFAVLSAFFDTVIPCNTAILGEVGLAGEIRPIAQMEKRIKEAEKSDCQKVIAPKIASLVKENKNNKFKTYAHLKEALAFFNAEK